MKAFERFCIGDCPAPEDINCSHMSCEECERIQEAIWRAAFRTIHDKFSVMGIDTIIAFIEKELEVTE